MIALAPQLPQAAAKTMENKQRPNPEKDGTWAKFVSENPRSVATRNLLIDYYDFIPSKIARRYSKRRMPYAPLLTATDVLADARIGLMEAVDDYDPAQGSFETFATWRVRGAIVDGLRNLQNLTRNISSQRRELAPIIEQMTHELCRAPTPDEIAERHPYKQVGDNYLRDFVHDPLLNVQVFNQKGGNASSDADDQEFSFDEQLARQRNNLPFSVDARIARQELIGMVLDILEDSPNEQRVVFFYYFCNMTSSQISKTVGFSQTMVSEVKINGLNKLRRYARLNDYDGEFVDMLRSLETQI